MKPVYGAALPSSHVNLGLRDAAARRPLLHRRRSKVVRRSAPQDDFLLTSGQHLVQLVWMKQRKEDEQKGKYNKTLNNDITTNHDMTSLHGSPDTT